MIPPFVEVDLTQLADEGVLWAANERFFWPLGLALTWEVDDDLRASRLHVRAYEVPPGRKIETIALEDGERYECAETFALWLGARMKRMAPEETGNALAMAGWVMEVLRS